jgi:hypothetical protein
MTRRFSDISHELVLVGRRWWGDMYWIDGGPLGCEVRRFDDPARLRAYAALQEEAFGWGHSDPLAWHVLVIEPPREVGEDFVIMRRYPGVPIAHFYRDHTDDPVEPPVPELALLADTVARMRTEATAPTDKLLAELVAKRLARLDPRIAYDMSTTEHRFHLCDLDPDEDELAAWMAIHSA